MSSGSSGWCFMRGKIMHRDRKRQILDFSNMLFDYKITPTDIDGLIEYRDKCFILFEIKLRDDDKLAPLPFGQQLALERIVDDLNKPAIVLIASHSVSDTSKDVDAAECIVEQYYWNEKWSDLDAPVTTLKTACDNFVRRYGEE